MLANSNPSSFVEKSGNLRGLFPPSLVLILLLRKEKSGNLRGFRALEPAYSRELAFLEAGFAGNLPSQTDIFCFHLVCYRQVTQVTQVTSWKQITSVTQVISCYQNLRLLRLLRILIEKRINISTGGRTPRYSSGYSGYLFFFLWYFIFRIGIKKRLFGLFGQDKSLMCNTV